MFGFVSHFSIALVLIGAEYTDSSEKMSRCADDPSYSYFQYNMLDLLTVRRGYNLMSLQSREYLGVIMSNWFQGATCCVHCEVISIAGNLCGGVMAVGVEDRGRVAEETFRQFDVVNSRWREVDFNMVFEGGYSVALFSIFDACADVFCSEEWGGGEGCTADNGGSSDPLTNWNDPCGLGLLEDIVQRLREQPGRALAALVNLLDSVRTACELPTLLKTSSGVWRSLAALSAVWNLPWVSGFPTAITDARAESAGDHVAMAYRKAPELGAEFLSDFVMKRVEVELVKFGPINISN